MAANNYSGHNKARTEETTGESLMNLPTHASVILRVRSDAPGVISRE
ncbi:hypothetical protein Hbor_37820 (plasmid) [Halogeometricum borinquense DSM 11551]|uniref:Uncharacterized protein n=1 Tax=Halogeometricum borinquense (strain ATCC 700274 / DSM 11551 / JCM 10706 / KCTC 4070 / PR3) TaxID=469382 RepID=E4NWR7_HALBP|nr:hypothetical protein Hbor_37820 [Halogeometricum borinquense DSM 11551]